MEWMLFLKNMGKVGGRDKDVTVTTLVLFWCKFACLLFVTSFFPSVCSFPSSSSQFKVSTSIWMEYRITEFVSVCVCLYTQIYCTVITATVVTKFKGYCSKPTPLSHDSKHIMVLQWNGFTCESLKESELNIYRRSNIFLSNTYLVRTCTDTRKRERERKRKRR